MSADGSAPCRVSPEDRAFILNATALRSMLTYKALARRLGLSPRQVRTVIEVDRSRRERRMNRPDATTPIASRWRDDSGGCEPPAF